jgi:hypothetical protein
MDELTTKILERGRMMVGEEHSAKNGGAQLCHQNQLHL